MRQGRECCKQGTVVDSTGQRQHSLTKIEMKSVQMNFQVGMKATRNDYVLTLRHHNKREKKESKKWLHCAHA